MDSLSYIAAWLVYLLSALGLVLVFWRLTRNMRLRRTRRALRALVAVFLFTPILIEQEHQWFAPAYLVGGYDWILGNNERAIEAGLYLSLAYSIMIIVILLEAMLRRLFGLTGRY